MSTQYNKGQTWGALKKAWKAYKIAKVQNDKAKMLEYAKRIRTLQEELGLPKASFPELNLS
ncbi:MAG: hypothetical protein QXY52_01405 [Conexivisphaerales archaeon]|jgi:hypothetical protein|nr:hypothetical protein [Nitrososphaerota archaeon]MDG6928146.1 hypothetical protein [Nitrososphaerota archaeon]MDG6930985.1 hypothetical protein [Nitrososphaerota archaeon]MDG6932809.1 hypothetical protein [Nitrososphaerota archaeon]MDG6935308.1 hypothetical protein [Nitrososphaerota archaeon]